MTSLSKWLKGILRMPDFPTHHLGFYRARLRPNDRIRRHIPGDFLPYFSDAYFQFDIQVFVPRSSLRSVDDVVKYEWILCDADFKQVECGPDVIIRFNTFGTGDFRITGERKHATALSQNQVTVTNKDTGLRFRKKAAIDIGVLPWAQRYNLAVRFSFDANEPYRSDAAVYEKRLHGGGFNVFHKDQIRKSFLIGIVIILLTAVVSAILRVFGVVS